MLVQIVVRTTPVDDQEIAVGLQYQQRMVPDAASLVHTLRLGRGKGLQASKIAGIFARRHDRQLFTILQRIKSLTSRPVPLPQVQRRWHRARLAPEDVDQRRAALGGDIRCGQIAMPYGEALVDRKML